MMKKTILIIWGVISFIPEIYAQTKAIPYDPQYEMIHADSWVQDKNFYLFTLLEELPEVRSVIIADKTLRKLTEERKGSVEQYMTTCPTEAACISETFLWSEEQIQLVSKQLRTLFRKHDALKTMVHQHIQKSGYYAALDTSSISEETLLIEAWELCAKGINGIIQTYGQGKMPLYPAIDSATYQTNSSDYGKFVWLWANEVKENTSEESLFFESSLQFALALLNINDRDEAGRYEPMVEKENKAAYEFISTINWLDYPYSAILVLGAGSEIYGVELTPLGKLNLQLAMHNYDEKLAPVIIVSGGHVHPFRTPFCEAIEMKKALMEKYGVPEYRILIDPHARHTTTNIRNASRLMIQYGMPLHKPALVTTNIPHSQYVASDKFSNRCLRELGYMPGKIGKRISSSTLEFTPQYLSRQQNPLDPLDP